MPCYWRAQENGKSVAVRGEKKGRRWQGNRSSLSRRLCRSTASHWWVPAKSLEQTDGVAPYVSHKRRLSRNNACMEMTCRHCNPGLPVCLAVCVARPTWDKITNCGSVPPPLWDCVWSGLPGYNMCAAGDRLSPSAHPLLAGFWQDV